MRPVYMTGRLHVTGAVVLIVTELVHTTLPFKRMETHILLAKRTGESCGSRNLTSSRVLVPVRTTLLTEHVDFCTCLI